MDDLTEAPPPGATFAVKLPGSMYVAVRVVSVSSEDSSVLLAVCDWAGDELPAKDEPGLRRVLRRHRGRFDGEPALIWYSLPPPRGLIPIGVIRGEGQELVARGYGGDWTPTIGEEALWERGISTRAEPHGNMEEEAPGYRDLEHLDDQFWPVIDALNWKADSDEEVLAPAVRLLARHDEKTIIDFNDWMCTKLFALDTEAHAQALGLLDSNRELRSLDEFLYARCSIVARGRAEFEEVLGEPDKSPQGADFEALLSLPESALQLQSGKRTDIASGVSYESYSNKEGWRRGDDRASK